MQNNHKDTLACEYICPYDNGEDYLLLTKSFKTDVSP